VYPAVGLSCSNAVRIGDQTAEYALAALNYLFKPNGLIKMWENTLFPEKLRAAVDGIGQDRAAWDMAAWVRQGNSSAAVRRPAAMPATGTAACVTTRSACFRPSRPPICPLTRKVSCAARPRTVRFPRHHDTGTSPVSDNSTLRCCTTAARDKRDNGR